MRNKSASDHITVPYTVQGSSREQCGAVEYSGDQQSALQCGNAQQSTVIQYITVDCSAAVQSRAVQNSTIVLYSPSQYSTYLMQQVFKITP